MVYDFAKIKASFKLKEDFFTAACFAEKFLENETRVHEGQRAACDAESQAASVVPGRKPVVREPDYVIKRHQMHEVKKLMSLEDLPKSSYDYYLDMRWPSVEDKRNHFYIAALKPADTQLWTDTSQTPLVCDMFFLLVHPCIVSILGKDYFSFYRCNGADKKEQVCCELIQVSGEERMSEDLMKALMLEPARDSYFQVSEHIKNTFKVIIGGAAEVTIDEYLQRLKIHVYDHNYEKCMKDAKKDAEARKQASKKRKKDEKTKLPSLSVQFNPATVCTMQPAPVLRAHILPCGLLPGCAGNGMLGEHDWDCHGKPMHEHQSGLTGCLYKCLVTGNKACTSLFKSVAFSRMASDYARMLPTCKNYSANKDDEKSKKIQKFVEEVQAEFDAEREKALTEREDRGVDLLLELSKPR